MLLSVPENRRAAAVQVNMLRCRRNIIMVSDDVVGGC